MIEKETTDLRGASYNAKQDRNPGHNPAMRDVLHEVAPHPQAKRRGSAGTPRTHTHAQDRADKTFSTLEFVLPRTHTHAQDRAAGIANIAAKVYNNGMSNRITSNGHTTERGGDEL